MKNKKRLNERRMLKDRFAKTLTKERKKKEWTMTLLAEKVGTTKQAICAIEAGDCGVNFHTALLLGKALDIDLNDFK